MRVKITLRCNECKQRNYNTVKNKKNDPDRLEMKKYCKFWQQAHASQRDEVRLWTGSKAERVNEMAEASKKQNIFVRAWARIKRFFREMKSEMKKVVRPTKSQLINNTIIVLVCVVVVGIFIWAFDAIASLVVQGIISLVKG